MKRHFGYFLFVFSFINFIRPDLAAQPAWQPLGPVHNPGLGIGRLECIAFDPGYNGTSNKIMYVASPTGGLWKSTNSGESWSNKECSTDKLPFIGVACIAINPKNGKQIFIASGTRYKRKHVSPLEIYKTDDGGKNWASVSDGLFLDPGALNCIARIIIDPKHPKTLYAATSQGIYKTTNAGLKWKKILEGDYHGLECNPNHPKIIYVAGTRSNYGQDLVVMRSPDAGKTWEVVADRNSVFKTQQNMTIDISLAPSDPKIIYVLVANKDGEGNNSLYVSVDAGKSWREKRMPFPNDHRDKASIGVNPTNPGEIYVGKAWDFYKSVNITDTNFTHRPNWQGLSIGHADVHYFAFAPKTHELFVAEDGGLWNASQNKDVSVGLNIATINSIGTSETKAGFVMSGHQDAGGNIYDASLPVEKQWRNILGGDGRESIIDFSNEKNIISASVNLGKAGAYGPNQRSMDGGVTFHGISIPKEPDLNALNNGPMVQDPVDSNVYYFGYTQLFKATFIKPKTNEIKWERLTQLKEMKPFTVLTDIAVNRSNHKYIYAGFVGGRIFKTNVGGEGDVCTSDCWKEISPFENLDYYNWVKIASATNNPEHVWIAFAGTSMYQEHVDSATKGPNKIMYSENGGAAWKSFAQGLPESPVYAITYLQNSKDLLFIGTEMGVYYRDATMNEWKQFSDLPNVIVNELEVNYHEKKLYAATYGRGLWSIDISKYINKAD